MLIMEQELTEAEAALLFLQEAVHDPKNQKLREELIDPVISVLEKPAGRKQYIDYGSSFLGENATMLSREYPTKAVTFPRKYVDGLFAMFNFTVKSFKVVLKDVLKSVSSSSEFATVRIQSIIFLTCITSPGQEYEFKTPIASLENLLGVVL